MIARGRLAFTLAGSRVEPVPVRLEEGLGRLVATGFFQPHRVVELVPAGETVGKLLARLAASSTLKVVTGSVDGVAVPAGTVPDLPPRAGRVELSLALERDRSVIGLSVEARTVHERGHPALTLDMLMAPVPAALADVTEPDPQTMRRKLAAGLSRSLRQDTAGWGTVFAEVRNRGRVTLDELEAHGRAVLDVTFTETDLNVDAPTPEALARMPAGPEVASLWLAVLVDVSIAMPEAFSALSAPLPVGGGFFETVAEDGGGTFDGGGTDVGGGAL